MSEFIKTLLATLLGSSLGYYLSFKFSEWIANRRIRKDMKHNAWVIERVRKILDKNNKDVIYVDDTSKEQEIK